MKSRTFILAGIAAVALIPTHVAWAQEAGTDQSAQRDFNLPTQALAQAALRFSEQAGVQLVLGGSVADGIQSNPVTGRFTTAQALDRLLAGTGLNWRWLNGRTVTIEAGSGSEPRAFSALRIEGTVGDGGDFADLSGFGRGAGVNGSSDVTATEGSGRFASNSATVASKIPIDKQKVAQSISTVTRERLEQQNLTSLNDVLLQTPGLTTVQSGAGPTFLSRGVIVDGYSIDGGAMQTFSTVGASAQILPLDMAEFDHVDLVRGSAALFAGPGNPSGVVNLQRKRPLEHAQISATAQIGSYENFRAEIDGTGPITANGHLRARLGFALQSNDFYYDVTHQETRTLYGSIEQDLGDRTLIRIGGNYSSSEQTGLNPGGLPRYLNGDDLRLPRSTCLCATWAYQDQERNSQYITLEHEFAKDWRLNLNVARATIDTDYAVPSVTGVGVNQANGVSQLTMSSIFLTKFGVDDYSANGDLSGVFRLFGQEQRFVVGGDYFYSTIDANIDLNNSFTPVAVDPFTFNSASLGAIRPAGGPNPSYIASSNKIHRWGAYAKLLLTPIEPVLIAGGLRWNNQINKADSLSSLYFSFFGTGFYLNSESSSDIRDKDILTPSASITVTPIENLSVYLAYDSVYVSNAANLDTNLQPLPSQRGRTFEAGVKLKLNDGRLQATLSAYNTDKTHQPHRNGSTTTPLPTGINCCFIDTGSFISRGIDFELVGEVLPRWQIQLSYNYNDNKYSDAYLAQVNASKVDSEKFPALAFTQQPRHMAKLWTSYGPSGALDGLTVSGGVRWESSRAARGTICKVTPSPTGDCPILVIPGPPRVIDYQQQYYEFRQGAYAIADVRIGYRINANWELSANINNIFDTRYYATMGTPTGGNYYGEPRTVMGALRMKY